MITQIFAVWLLLLLFLVVGVVGFLCGKYYSTSSTLEIVKKPTLKSHNQIIPLKTALGSLKSKKSKRLTNKFYRK